MKNTETTNVKKDKAVLVGVSLKENDDQQINEFLNELEFLVYTSGYNVVKRFTQKLTKPLPGTYIGSGKLKEIAEFVKQHEITLVVFDDELTPSQQRNLEKELQCDVQDRTSLILTIFAQRARTSHAKAQVELARYQYVLPRLKRMWTHLERQRGGTGTRSGSGELQIESDKRIVLEKISKLKNELKTIDKQMLTQRKNRDQLVRVALVGYTNVGKSTLMNMLSKSEVFAENKLFATLDTTVRKVVIGNLPFLLSDTVGFIRKLPTHLIESFKSTLDEVREADLLLHVVDISHPTFEEQINVVNETLKDLKALDKPTILIFNKIDAYHFTEKDPFDLSEKTKENVSIEELRETWMGKLNNDCIFISATKKENIEPLRELLYKKIKQLHVEIYPHKLLY
ncbi:GTPase HflX [Flavobacteriales bacterium]|nr:GTPase HflX [Flavobacteriales bacterium]MCL4815425.1 GTPase HflX [Flavobacteriales bacterium]WKZ75044.1 MAG: GTPase HflX [Vicingaceae bacterium]GIK69986.1 MAG: GTPase HflX [Bacteroidota bacterium]CAG0959213.1 GTPase HflX [Flavobacteriales bacterium]